MGTSGKVIDDVQAGSVLDIALGSLRARNTPMLKVEGLYWILDENLRPAIVVGYGTKDPEKMSSIHHIIKFHVRQRPIFNVVSAMEDYSVKHTRVATPNVVLFHEKIPATNILAARNYLEGQYINYVLDVIDGFRDRKYEVPTVAQFEIKAEINKAKKKKAAKALKAKASKSTKRARFAIEEDDEDGPLRCLTPIRKLANVQPERADSMMGEVGNSPSPNFTYQDSADGLTLVIDPDTPINSIEDGHELSTSDKSIEDCHGLSTPISMNDTVMQNSGSTACTAQEALFEPC
ncbi:hypothetical protein E4T50_09237 [Aureobasidium sp. EXF-12298]|nr:hypothetical protein E4T50_09237 [Aureobasidium sp. EXF-12298]